MRPQRHATRLRAVENAVSWSDRSARAPQGGKQHRNRSREAVCAHACVPTCGRCGVSQCLGTSPRRPSLQVDSGWLLGPLTCVLGRRGQSYSRLTVPRVLGQACTLSPTGQVRGSCRTPAPPTSEATSTDPHLHLPCQLWTRTHHLGRPSPGANSPIASLAAQPGRALTDGDPGAPAHGSGYPTRHERARPDVLLSCCSSFHCGLDTAGQMPDSDTSSGHTVCWLSPHFTKSTQRGRCHVWPCARGLGCPRERGCEVGVLQGRHRPEQTRNVWGQGAPPRPQSQVCTRVAQPAGTGQQAAEWRETARFREAVGASRKLFWEGAIAGPVRAPWM